jgi:hypothetical protein
MKLDADVLIQAGHEGRTRGATGAASPYGSELAWTPVVADEATKQLEAAGYRVLRVGARLRGPYRVRLALFLHFDGSNPPGRSGASIGYDDPTDEPAAGLWRAFYGARWPFKWMPDNFTRNLRRYYGYRHTVTTDAELLLELGDLTSKEQALWMLERLQEIGGWVAEFAQERMRGVAP